LSRLLLLLRHPQELGSGRLCSSAGGQTTTSFRAVSWPQGAEPSRSRSHSLSLPVSVGLHCSKGQSSGSGLNARCFPRSKALAPKLNSRSLCRLSTPFARASAAARPVSLALVGRPSEGTRRPRPRPRRRPRLAIADNGTADCNARGWDRDGGGGRRRRWWRRLTGRAVEPRRGRPPPLIGQFSSFDGGMQGKERGLGSFTPFCPVSSFLYFRRAD
jgi:hypothetical protein